jgi:hypothetical protein
VAQARRLGSTASRFRYKSLGLYRAWYDPQSGVGCGSNASSRMILGLVELLSQSLPCMIDQLYDRQSRGVCGSSCVCIERTVLFDGAGCPVVSPTK